MIIYNRLENQINQIKDIKFKKEMIKHFKEFEAVAKKDDIITMLDILKTMNDRAFSNACNNPQDTTIELAIFNETAVIHNLLEEYANLKTNLKEYKMLLQKAMNNEPILIKDSEEKYLKIFNEINEVLKALKN